jgi:hypothetical protein
MTTTVRSSWSNHGDAVLAETLAQNERATGAIRSPFFVSGIREGYFLGSALTLPPRSAALTNSAW